MHPLERKVGSFLHRHGGSASGLVVAVSGGPDSVALLRALLVVLGPETPLVVAHLNHLLRGAESDADAAFVHSLHESLSAAGATRLTLCLERIDVRARAEAEGGNLEDVARRVRYDWLAGVARGSGLGLVATGHTADDQAETVLHRLLRGTGLRGLRGIAARRPLAPAVGLVRPLLGVRRAEVLGYLEALHQPSREDSSNLDPRFTRNRIRRELIPLLEESYNPALVPLLARLADQADAIYRDLEAVARWALAEAERPRAGASVILDRAALARLPRHLVREVFRLVWQREGWPLGRMGFEAWDRLAGLASGQESSFDLPGGIHAVCHERVVQVGPRP